MDEFFKKIAKSDMIDTEVFVITKFLVMLGKDIVRCMTNYVYYIFHQLMFSLELVAV